MCIRDSIGPMQLPTTSFEENCFIQVAPIRSTRKKALATTKDRFQQNSSGQGQAGSNQNNNQVPSNQANKDSKAQLSHDSSGFGRTFVNDASQ